MVHATDLLSIGWRQSPIGGSSNRFGPWGIYSLLLITRIFLSFLARSPNRLHTEWNWHPIADHHKDVLFSFLIMLDALAPKSSPCPFSWVRNATPNTEFQLALSKSKFEWIGPIIRVRWPSTSWSRSINMTWTREKDVELFYLTHCWQFWASS